jgi:hypothetical protein
MLNNDLEQTIIQYTLDQLSDRERSVFEYQMRIHPELSDKVCEYEKALGALCHTLPSEKPSVHLKASILSKIAPPHLDKKTPHHRLLLSGLAALFILGFILARILPSVSAQKSTQQHTSTVRTHNHDAQTENATLTTFANTETDSDALVQELNRLRHENWLLKNAVASSSEPSEAIASKERESIKERIRILEKENVRLRTEQKITRMLLENTELPTGVAMRFLKLTPPAESSSTLNLAEIAKAMESILIPNQTTEIASNESESANQSLDGRVQMSDFGMELLETTAHMEIAPSPIPTTTQSSAPTSNPTQTAEALANSPKALAIINTEAKTAEIILQGDYPEGASTYWWYQNVQTQEYTYLGEHSWKSGESIQLENFPEESIQLIVTEQTNENDPSSIRVIIQTPTQ